MPVDGERSLVEGDIVGIDCGVLYKGYYGDSARSFAVGKVSDQAARLLGAAQLEAEVGAAYRVDDGAEEVQDRRARPHAP